MKTRPEAPTFPNRRHFFCQLAAGATLTGLGKAAEPAIASGLDFQNLLRPVPRTAKFEMDGYFVWGASLVRDPRGKCHLFFARWPKSTTFRGWVSHSEVGHAVADDPLGPYRFQDLALSGAGGAAWDAHMIHNPTVMESGGKYYLFYTGTHGNESWRPNQPLSSQDDYWVCRNNQRIGVAVADHPDGPWKRFDRPALDVTPGGWDSLITTNPSITPTPDGRFLLVYKAASPGEKPVGKVVHGVALADQPTGPFVKHPHPIFTHQAAEFPAEDPTIWRGDDRYYAIVKDMGGFFTDAGRSLVLFESADGFDWKLSAHPLVSPLQIRWADGEVQKVNRLERPQLYRESGRPAVLFCAVHLGGKNEHSFNVHIPLGK